MDAASNNGVENIRDLIDSIQYAPVSARYKVYILDEVHMLSKPAFNAILKTLEEPPPHVKFIFATTEIRKIPVTIISRCQKFDLKRVEMEELTQHLINIATKENIALPTDCAALIAAAAEGSVRDSLSLLDQAIAMHTDSEGNVSIALPTVREMLGLADKSQSFTLLKLLFNGRTDEALAAAQALHHQGADPVMLLSDLLDITHYLTRIVVSPVLANNLQYSPHEQTLAQEMAASLSVPALTRAWQILTKGSEEMRHADHTASILEMILVRLGYASQLPTPAELVKSLQSNPPSLQHAAVNAAPRAAASPAHVAPITSSARSEFSTATSAPSGATVMSAGGAATAAKIEPVALAEVHSFAELVQLFEEKREPILANHLINDMRFVRFEHGRIEVKPVGHMNPDIPARINRRLMEWTGAKWTIVYNENADGEPTIRDQRNVALRQARDYAIAHPKVQAVLDMFPGAIVADFTPNKS